MNHVRRTRVGVLAAAILALGAVAPAQAAINTTGPTASVNTSNGALEVRFKVTGLGNTSPGVSATVSGLATAVRACRNNSGGFPAAANKQATSANISSTGSFSVDKKNGSITGFIAVAAPAATPALKCGQGQTAVLVSVSYTNLFIDFDPNLYNLLDQPLSDQGYAFYVM